MSHMESSDKKTRPEHKLSLICEHFIQNIQSGNGTKIFESFSQLSSYKIDACINAYKYLFPVFDVLFPFLLSVLDQQPRAIILQTILFVYKFLSHSNQEEETIKKFLEKDFIKLFFLIFVRHTEDKEISNIVTKIICFCIYFSHEAALYVFSQIEIPFFFSIYIPENIQSLQFHCFKNCTKILSAFSYDIEDPAFIQSCLICYGFIFENHITSSMKYAFKSISNMMKPADAKFPNITKHNPPIWGQFDFFRVFLPSYLMNVLTIDISTNSQISILQSAIKVIYRFYYHKIDLADLEPSNLVNIVRKLYSYLNFDGTSLPEHITRKKILSTLKITIKTIEEILKTTRFQLDQYLDEGLLDDFSIIISNLDYKTKYVILSCVCQMIRLSGNNIKKMIEKNVMKLVLESLVLEDDDLAYLVLKVILNIFEVVPEIFSNKQNEVDLSLLQTYFEDFIDSEDESVSKLALTLSQKIFPSQKDISHD